MVGGGGYIGLELGSVWSRLGARVTVLEDLDGILPTMDGEVARQMARALARQGLTLRTGTRVAGAERRGDAVRIAVEPAGGGAAESIDCDVVLVAVGRRPFTGGLGLEEAGSAATIVASSPSTGASRRA